jgi:uncharacterized protein YchJ
MQATSDSPASGHLLCRPSIHPCENVRMDGLACPCGLGDDYASCCGRLHAGAPAWTAESLMRSRYSAFAVGDAGYLLRTWHPSGRPRTLSLDPALRWTRLAVLETRDGGLFDTSGTVTAGCSGSVAAGSSARRLRSSAGAFPADAPVTGRRLRRRRRRCKWRAGPAAAPSAARNTGAPVRSPMTRLIARAVRGASAMVMTLPPLRVIARVRRVTGARARPLLPVPWRSFRCNVEIGQYLGSVALMHDRDRTNHVQTFCLRN